MFHHVALLTFKEGTTTEQVAALEAGLGALPQQIDALIGYRFGSDVGITAGAWDYAVVADFTDRAGYETYRDHPAHVEVLTHLTGPVTASIARVQFET